MAKNKKKRRIKIFFTDGKVDIIPQKLWDDYEVNGNLFVIKKNGEWVAFYKMKIIDCMATEKER